MTEPKKRVTVTQVRTELQEELRVQEANFTERIAELELANEDRGWRSLSGASDQEFSREGLQRIVSESRLFYRKNPIIIRAVNTITDYTFAQGVTFKATSPVVNSVIQAFLDDPKNKAEITTVLAMVQKDHDLQVAGNLYFVFFTNDNGDTRVRTINFDEIADIQTNPEDAREPWFYVREYTQKGMGRKELYPDWRYQPKSRPETIGGLTVLWDKPVYHVKVNAFSFDKFGLSEIYSAQDWARAYVRFLSDWSTIVRSYARFAWQIVTKGKSAARAAVKTKLDSKISSDGYNPSPATGAAFIASEGTSLNPIKTSGATTSADDGRQLLLMVCAATGVFEHFMGNPSTSNLATAKTLNRPMELSFLLRQKMWEEIWENIFSFVIETKARAGVDGLSGMVETDAWGEEVFIYANDVDNEDEALRDEPINTFVDIGFPPIIEHDVKELVESIVGATTLNGNPPAGTLDIQYTTKLLLQALGETSVEEVMAELFPEDEGTPEEESLREAVVKLRATAKRLAEVTSA